MSSPRQAQQVVGNLARFEAPGGILTSTETSGSQWDAPFGWGPLQLMAVGGLRRYGYQAHADRIARKFVSLVVQDFDAHHAIVEKYDVRRRSSDLAAGLKFGYTSNEVGFGWTNAAVVELLAGLERRRAVASAAESSAIVSVDGTKGLQQTGTGGEWSALMRPHEHDQRRTR